MILLGGGGHIEAEHEDQVGDDDQEAHHEENEALENFVPGDCIVEEILSVRLEQRMMAGAVLQPHGRRGKQCAAGNKEIMSSLNQDRHDMFGIHNYCRSNFNLASGIGLDACSIQR